MKKGFTIAELMGVIIILSLIVIIAFPQLLKSVKDTESTIDESLRTLIITSSSQYVTRHSDKFSNVNDSNYCIVVDDLIKEGLISENNLSSDSITKDSCVSVSVKDYNYNYDIDLKCTCKGEINNEN